MKLIENWKRAYRMYSVQVMGFIVALGAAWPLIPDDLKSHLPADMLPYISVLALLGIVFRLVKQEPKE